MKMLVGEWMRGDESCLKYWLKDLSIGLCPLASFFLVRGRDEGLLKVRRDMFRATDVHRVEYAGDAALLIYQYV